MNELTVRARDKTRARLSVLQVSPVKQNNNLTGKLVALCYSIIYKKKVAQHVICYLALQMFTVLNKPPCPENPDVHGLDRCLRWFTMRCFWINLMYLFFIFYDSRDANVAYTNVVKRASILSDENIQENGVYAQRTEIGHRNVCTNNRTLLQTLRAVHSGP